MDSHINSLTAEHTNEEIPVQNIAKMKYMISAPHPSNRLVEIELRVDQLEGDEVTFQLPAWRPGRYELGNFARNIRKFEVINSSGESMPFKKVRKDCWQVKKNGSTSITVKYNYYAAQPDAGACWLDEEQLYVNPVHCMLYIPERVNEPCELKLNLPLQFQVASSLKKLSEHVLFASDFHELVDSPLIASPSLKYHSFSTSGVTFHVWLQGDCEPQWEKIVHDFRRFSHEQVAMMGDFPASEYHFLVQVLPFKFYHGVEHLKSTVIAIGPGSELMDSPLYLDFTGVASHELFHAWNIKTIRPVEMMPYDYSHENYSRLGYVYEGVTSYYGDLFLARSGVYSINQFFNKMSLRLQRHFDSFGRFNLSVADSSFDTWLDGYNPGIPNRKTSIYDKGCIVALITDFLIRKHSNSRASLDDVMKILYSDFGKKKIGYTEYDYMAIIENLVGKNLTDFFIDHVYGIEDDEPMLSEALALAACELVKKPNSNYFERFFGFKISDAGGLIRISALVPGGVADKAGLSIDDEILAVNETRVENNLNELCSLHTRKKILLTISTPMKKLKDVSLTPGPGDYYPVFAIRKKEKATPDEQRFFKGWLKQDFYQ